MNDDVITQYSFYYFYCTSGLRLVQAAISANASVTKNEKAANLEAAKKMFESGDRNGAPYPNKPSDEFVGYDTGTFAAEAQAKASVASQKRGFWGRVR